MEKVVSMGLLVSTFGVVQQRRRYAQCWRQTVHLLQQRWKGSSVRLALVHDLFPILEPLPSLYNDFQGWSMLCFGQ